MHPQQLIGIGIGAIAFAGAAFAQTVPPEAWVGAPIATTGGRMNRAEVGADLDVALRVAARTPQELRVGAPDAPAGALKRSEVLADFKLWDRAGLNQHPDQAHYDPLTANGQRRMANYQRLRMGPAFTLEVARIEGASNPGVANAQAAQASSE